MQMDSVRKVTQLGNRVKGDLIAGNKIVHESEKTPLRVMLENYRKEIEDSENLTEFIEELQDYMKRTLGPEQRDLEQKLLAAHRQDLINNAKLLKENFSKKLYKHTFSPKAQLIFVHIMAIIKNCFNMKILPMLRESKPISEIDRAIYDCILEDIYKQVGYSELELTMDHVHGMLYYLTGNCYINWD